MAGRNRKKQGRSLSRPAIAVGLLLAALAICVIAAHLLEAYMSVEIENAGMQMTPHTSARSTAQVFMNDRWYAERNIESLLVMGIDESGGLEETDSYNNSSQTDFLVLFLRDVDTGRTAAIHINRDTMTDINTLGVTGQITGTRRAQLALAYNYGGGDHVSSMNVVTAVEHLLYGMEIDHYITITMDAVPILNDWAGGVTIEVLDDFTGVDERLKKGELVKLDGQQALAYVRSRKGLDDATNLRRMERQRQYVSEWMRSAKNELQSQQAVTELVLQLDDYYRSNCTVEQLISYAESQSSSSDIPVYEIKGQATQGGIYMEYHVDEDALQALVLDLFYAPVE